MHTYTHTSLYLMSTNATIPKAQRRTAFIITAIPLVSEKKSVDSPASYITTQFINSHESSLQWCDQWLRQVLTAGLVSLFHLRSQASHSWDWRQHRVLTALLETLSVQRSNHSHSRRDWDLCQSLVPTVLTVSRLRQRLTFARWQTVRLQTFAACRAVDRWPPTYDEP